MNQMPLLTADELVVLERLAEASSLFLGLSEHRKYDRAEWAERMHALSNMVMARAAIRGVPGIDWTPLLDSSPASPRPGARR